MDPLPPPEVWTPLLQFLQGPAPEAGGVASAPEAGGVASPLSVLGLGLIHLSL